MTQRSLSPKPNLYVSQRPRRLESSPQRPQGFAEALSQSFEEGSSPTIRSAIESWPQRRMKNPCESVKSVSSVVYFGIAQNEQQEF